MSQSINRIPINLVAYSSHESTPLFRLANTYRLAPKQVSLSQFSFHRPRLAKSHQILDKVHFSGQKSPKKTKVMKERKEKQIKQREMSRKAIVLQKKEFSSQNGQLKFKLIARSSQAFERKRQQQKIDNLIAKKISFWDKLNKRLKSVSLPYYYSQPLNIKAPQSLITKEQVNKQAHRLSQLWLQFASLPLSVNQLTGKIIRLEAFTPLLKNIFLDKTRKIKTQVVDSKFLTDLFQLFKPLQQRKELWPKADMALFKALELFSFRLEQLIPSWQSSTVKQSVEASKSQTQKIDLLFKSMKEKHFQSRLNYQRLQQFMRLRRGNSMRSRKDKFLRRVQEETGGLEKVSAGERSRNELIKAMQDKS